MEFEKSAFLLLLPQEAETAGAGQQEVAAEIVVEIRRDDAVPRRWSRLRAARKIQRRRLGLCPACGYDLRESPERCPECGKVPGEADPPGAAGVGS